VAVGLSGYLFFGSAVLLTERVTKLAQDMVAQGADHARALLASSPRAKSATTASPALTPASAKLGSALSPPGAGLGGSGETNGGGGQLDAISPEKMAGLVEVAPCFVLLDFRRVLGVDATAAQLIGSLQVGCLFLCLLSWSVDGFRPLESSADHVFRSTPSPSPTPTPQIVLRTVGVELVLTRIKDDTVHRLLVAHGVISADAADNGAGGCCRVFPTLNEGEQYTEERWVAETEGAMRGQQNPLNQLSIL
jgi:hypothetical protein